MWRDQFGFRKLIVIGTSTGKLFGLDSSDGRIVWSRLLGKSTADESLEIEGVWVTRASQTGLRPQAVAVGVGRKGSVCLQI